MLPMGLSMLWESVDPERALRDRFGFTGMRDAADWMAVQLDQYWNIRTADLVRLAISDRNVIAWSDSNEGPLIIKFAADEDDFDRLAASAALVRFLGDRALPVAAPLRALDLSDRIVEDGPLGPLSIAVLPEVDGTWLDIGDRAAVHAAGACLAQLHSALAEYGAAHADAVERLRRPGNDAPLYERVSEWADRHVPEPAPDDGSAWLMDQLQEMPVLDEEPQLVHRDYRSANILTKSAKVVAVLDFDEAEVGYRVNDLAQACTYLGTRFTDWRPTPPEAQDTLRGGYESVRPFSAAEERWFEVLLAWQELAAFPGREGPAAWLGVD